MEYHAYLMNSLMKLSLVSFIFITIIFNVLVLHCPCPKSFCVMCSNLHCFPFGYCFCFFGLFTNNITLTSTLSVVYCWINRFATICVCAQYCHLESNIFFKEQDNETVFRNDRIVFYRKAIFCFLVCIIVNFLLC